MTHQQLTLFVPVAQAGPIEALRETLDPVQHALIPAHVTLCREDELRDAGDFRARLRNAEMGRLELSFGAPERSDGHGILVPCVSGTRAFQRLRQAILRSPSARASLPHITLAHPRNPRAPGNPEGSVHDLLPPRAFAFTAISLIEQSGPLPWRVLETFPLPAVGSTASNAA